MKQRGKNKKIKINEGNLRDLWNNVKYPNIQMLNTSIFMGVPEEDKKKGHDKILEQITVENVLKMGEEIATQI